MSWLNAFARQMIGLIDKRLQCKLGIFEYSDHPRCMFRVHITRADRFIKLPDGDIPVGTKILELHFWNDHIPPIPTEGASLARMANVYRMFKDSFTELALQIGYNPRLSGVQAVRGVMPYFIKGESLPVGTILTRLGFDVKPYRGYGGFFGLLGKQIHGLMIMFLFNPFSLKKRDLFNLRWVECWMSTEDLIRLHSKKNSSSNRVLP